MVKRKCMYKKCNKPIGNVYFWLNDKYYHLECYDKLNKVSSENRPKNISLEMLEKRKKILDEEFRLLREELKNVK